MIHIVPIAVPMVDLTRWIQVFPSRGWPVHEKKPMEQAVSAVPDDHLYFTFLAEGSLKDLVALGWRKIRFGAEGYAILSGSLREWVDEIAIHCRDGSHPATVRRAFNAIVVFFIHIGLDRLWADKHKETLPDGTFIFV